MVDWWSFGILLYELMYGTTPFKSARRDTTFDNIVKRQPHFPHRGVSPEGRDLISKLLIKVSRLLATQQITRHGLFQSEVAVWPPSARQGAL
jgi:serine/threonine protein kinase